VPYHYEVQRAELIPGGSFDVDVHTPVRPTEPAGTVSYAWASREFRAAAARLSKKEPETESHAVASGDAARLLIDLSRLGANDELRRLLTPDPAESAPTWTVACFQVGNLAPIDVREFVDPSEAIAAVTDSDVAEHAASELHACSSGGLRWAAMSRTHGRILFQLPDELTLTHVAGGDPDEASPALAEALLRWRQRVADWSEKDGSERTGEVGAARESEADCVALRPSDDGRVDALEQRLLAIEAATRDAIAGVSRRMSRALVEFDGRFRVRIDTVEQRLMTTVHDGVRSLGEVDAATPEVSHAAAARANVERVAVEIELCDEIEEALTDLRDDVVPLTGEFVERLAAIGASVESELRHTSEVLGGHLELLRAVVTS